MSKYKIGSSWKEKAAKLKESAKKTYAKGKELYAKGKEKVQKTYAKGMEAKHSLERKTGKYKDSAEATAQKEKVRAEQAELARIRKGGRAETKSEKYDAKSKVYQKKHEHEAAKASKILNRGVTKSPADAPPTPPIKTSIYPQGPTVTVGNSIGSNWAVCNTFTTAEEWNPDTLALENTTPLHASFYNLGLYNYDVSHLVGNGHGDYSGHGERYPGRVVYYQHPATERYTPPHHNAPQQQHESGLGWAVAFAEGEGSSFQSPYFGGVAGGETATSVTPTVYSAGAGASKSYPIVPTPYGDYYGILGRPRPRSPYYNGGGGGGGGGRGMMAVQKNGYTDFLNRHPGLREEEWELLAPSIYRIYTVFWSYPVVFPLYGNVVFDSLPPIEKELWTDEQIMGDRIRGLERQRPDLYAMGARILPHFEMQKFIWATATVEDYLSVTEKVADAV